MITLNTWLYFCVFFRTLPTLLYFPKLHVFHISLQAAHFEASKNCKILNWMIENSANFRCIFIDYIVFTRRAITWLTKLHYFPHVKYLNDKTAVRSCRLYLKSERRHSAPNKTVHQIWFRLFTFIAALSAILRSVATMTTSVSRIGPCKYQYSGDGEWRLKGKKSDIHKEENFCNNKYNISVYVILAKQVIITIKQCMCLHIQGDTKKRELLKNPRKIWRNPRKKIIDRNWTITTCILRDSNPNYQCLIIKSCRWRPPPRMHSFTATTHFKSPRSFVSSCVLSMLCRMRQSRIL